MSRIREVADAEDDPVLTEVFDLERSNFGGVLNTSKVLAHCPQILQAAKKLGAAIERSDLLPSSLRSLVYLRVAILNGCPF
ncbi:MAG: hypothetical protein ACR2PG_01145 [Hyphomicrobiaceae bacterium]